MICDFQEKLSSPTLQDEITFSSELDLFHVVVNQCIQLLVADLEATCEPAFASMLKVCGWPSNTLVKKVIVLSSNIWYSPLVHLLYIH